MSMVNAVQRQILDTFTKKPDLPADRRKPRVFSSADGGQCDPCPYSLDFCMWLQSEHFGKNRLAHIIGAGGTWLGSLVAW